MLERTLWVAITAVRLELGFWEYVVSAAVGIEERFVRGPRKQNDVRALGVWGLGWLPNVTVDMF